MPPDRVFGGIEKQFRRKEVIVSPLEYYEILGQHGTVLKWGSDWHVSDFKSASKELLKSNAEFKMRDSKVFTFIKAKPTQVGFQYFYSDVPIFYETLKRNNVSFAVLSSASIVPKENKVSLKKKADVVKLMSFCAIPDDVETKEFYNDVLSSTATVDDENDKVVYADND